MKQHKWEKDGFTLVEVVVTITVATILIFAATLALNNMTSINERASDLILANATAEGKLESLRNQGYAALELGGVDFTDELPDELLEPREAVYTIDEPSGGVRRVELTITYNSGGTQDTQNYSTYIGEVGLGQ